LYAVHVAVNFWGELSCAQRTEGNESELNSTVKMETRHTTDESFGNEFPSIIAKFMAAWSQDVEKI